VFRGSWLVAVWGDIQRESPPEPAGHRAGLRLAELSKGLHAALGPPATESTFTLWPPAQRRAVTRLSRNVVTRFAGIRVVTPLPAPSGW